MVKLSIAAKRLGVTRMTLWNWKKKGIIEFHKIGHMNYIKSEDIDRLLGIKEQREDKTIIYARVSSTVNKSNLETQKQRLIDYCCAKGYQIDKVVTEFGSGLNDKRPKLTKLLQEPTYTRIVVEHKDRLTRFGFNYLEVLLKNQGITIEVINVAEEEKEDLIQDFISVITSFCARIYGQRRSKRATEKLIKEIAE